MVYNTSTYIFFQSPHSKVIHQLSKKETPDVFVVKQKSKVLAPPLCSSQTFFERKSTLDFKTYLTISTFILPFANFTFLMQQY